jgi:hypothetical protein
LIDDSCSEVARQSWDVDRDGVDFKAGASRVNERTNASNDRGGYMSQSAFFTGTCPCNALCSCP